MSARPMAIALLAFGLACAVGPQQQASGESELSAALTMQVGRLAVLDGHARERMMKPFTEHHVDAVGKPLATDPLASFQNQWDALLMGTQAAKLIDLLASVHVQIKCEDDRVLIGSIARKELRSSMSVVAHAADILEAESAVLGRDSDEGKIGVEGAAALREVFKTGRQLQIKVFPDK